MKKYLKEITEKDIYIALLILSITLPLLFVIIGYIINGEIIINKGLIVFLIVFLFSLRKVNKAE